MRVRLAAFVRAAATVASGPAGSGKARLQHSSGLPHPGVSGRRGTRAGSGHDSGASRGVAQCRFRWWTATRFRSSDPLERRSLSVVGSWRLGAERTETRRPGVIAEEEARRPFDLAPGTAAAGDAAASGRAGARAARQHSPHRLRWVVRRHLRRRARDALRGYRGGAAVALGAAADPVRGLRGLAAGVAARASARRAALLLEAAARGRSGRPGAAHRPPRPPVQSFRGATETVSISRELARGDPGARASERARRSS